MKHQKIYRLSLLPSHFYSSGQSSLSGSVTNLAEHFNENLQNHENHDFQAALAPKARFSSQGRRAAAQCFKWLVEPCSDRVIRGWGGTSWHFEKDLPFCNLGGSFLRILKNPWIHFGREYFSRMKHEKIYRLILLPFHFYSSGQSYSSGLVANLAEHFGGIWKIMKIMIFKPPWLPKHAFRARGAALPRNV